MNPYDIIANPDSPQYQTLKNYTEKLSNIYQRLADLPNSPTNSYLTEAVQIANKRVSQSAYLTNENSDDELIRIRPELLKKEEKSIIDYLSIGNISLYLYDYFTSFNSFACCLSESSTFNYGQLYLISLSLFHYQSYLSALQYLSSAVKHLKSPFLEDAHFRLGILYAKTLDYKKSINELSSFKNDAIPWISAQDITILISQAYYLMNDLTMATRHIETSEVITPAILQQACFFYLISNHARKFETGLNLLNNHVATNHSPFLLYLQSRLYFKRGQVTEAFESMKKALKMKDDEPLFWLVMGNIYFMTAQFHEAAGCFNRAMILDENMTEAWINYGATLELDSTIGDPVQFYQRAFDEMKIPEKKELLKRKNLIQSLGQSSIIPQIMEPNDKKLFKNVCDQLISFYLSENPIFTIEQIQNPELLISEDIKNPEVTLNAENQEEDEPEDQVAIKNEEEEEEEEDKSHE